MIRRIQLFNALCSFVFPHHSNSIVSVFLSFFAEWDRKKIQVWCFGCDPFIPCFGLILGALSVFRSSFPALNLIVIYFHSLQFQRQHSWNVRVPSIVHRPLHTLPHRHNAFKCRSFLTPGTQSELPVLKTTVGALKR